MQSLVQRRHARLLQVTQRGAQHLGVHPDVGRQLVLVHPLAPRQRVQRDDPQPCEVGLRAEPSFLEPHDFFFLEGRMTPG